MTRNRRGLTFVDLVVVMVILAMLAAALAPITNGARETSNRVKCASNLRQIGQAILLYANDNNGEYPRTTYAVNADLVNAYTGISTTNPFGPGGPAVNDVSAVLYLLLRAEDLTPGVFVCPQSQAVSMSFPDGTTKDDYSNFIDSLNLSYSLAVPYPSKAAVADGFRWDQTMPSDFAMAADMNPGAPELLKVRLTASSAAEERKANSLNHAQAGQNILYADGHVAWSPNPFAGTRQDNIFTYGPSGMYMDSSGLTPDHGPGIGIVGRPTHSYDSVLLPTALQDVPTAQRRAELGIAAPEPPGFWQRRLVLVGALSVFAIAAIVIAELMQRKRKPPDSSPPQS